MLDLAVIQTMSGCAAGAALAGVRQAHVARRRRWMARHPAPTFVFADLVGYTALTEAHGDEAAARLAREFRRTISRLCREHGAWQVKSMGASHARPNEALISWSTRSASRQELAWPPRSRCEVFLRGVEQPVSAWRLRA
jgi:class 3 adenylate cyclase